LLEHSRRKSNIKNRVEQVIEDAVVKYAVDFPAYGQHQVSKAYHHELY
jgi:hypothetical protein